MRNKGIIIYYLSLRSNPLKLPSGANHLPCLSLTTGKRLKFAVKEMSYDGTTIVRVGVENVVPRSVLQLPNL